MRPRIPLPDLLAGGPFVVRAGRDLGLSDKRMRGSDLASPFRGVRTAIAEDLDLLALCRAYTAVMREGDLFTHSTAARLWGCPLPQRWAQQDSVHVSTRAPTRAPTGRRVIGHSITLRDGFVVEQLGLPVADPATVFLQLATTLRLEDLVAVGDHLVHVPRYPSAGDPRPWVELDELRARAERAEGRGCRRARQAAALVRVGAESRPESLVRVALVQGGLPEPELNPDVLDRHGRFIGRADMLYRAARVIVEYDGEQHRTDDAQYDRDAARLEAFQAEGHLVVRARKGDLARLGPLVARVRAALHARMRTR